MDSLEIGNTEWAESRIPELLAITISRVAIDLA